MCSSSYIENEDCNPTKSEVVSGSQSFFCWASIMYFATAAGIYWMDGGITQRMPV